MSKPTSKSRKPHGALRAVWYSGKWKEIGTIPQDEGKRLSSSPSWFTAPAMNVFTTIRNGHVIVVCYGPDGIPKLLHKRKLKYWL
jgi:hypothetical protein